VTITPNPNSVEYWGMVELHLGSKKVMVKLHLGSKKYFNQIIMHLKGLDLFYLVTNYHLVIISVVKNYCFMHHIIICLLYMLRSKCIIGRCSTMPGQCILCPISMDNVDNYTLCPGIVQNDQSTVGNHN
jgi:hypothetical protein